MHDVLRINDKITILPVIHGSGDFALAVRQRMLAEKFDCVAVPLPPSFQTHVEQAIAQLPTPSVVTQAETPTYRTEWSPNENPDDVGWAERSESHQDVDDDIDEELAHSYVPIDPCQPVIAALRVALEEHLPRAFIDLETDRWEPFGQYLPDAYALKQVALERFAAAMLPAIPPPPSEQFAERCRHMGQRLAELEQRYESILLVCSVLEWPWVRDAYRSAGVSPASALDDDERAGSPRSNRYSVDPNTLIFMLGELPFITSLYERARSDLEDDTNLSIDGVKELLLAARDSYLREFKGRARKITPSLLRTTLRYIRNLSLVECRFTPDLYTLVIAAKQVLGDQYARHVAEQAREYQPSGTGVSPVKDGQARGHSFDVSHVKFGIERARLPDGDIVRMKSRLPGPPVSWRSLELQRKPEKIDTDRWRMQWNPYSHCSWPPEDELIENFRTHVTQRAMQIMGADLVRTEKFTTSVMDGIDIRDTLRNWHTGDIYVKVLPPARGTLDCVVMLFDTPADPRTYPMRTTWYAEHLEESTLAFYATDLSEVVGPGIALSTYGGAMFLFPPVSIPDIWTDPRLDFAETLEDRLIAAACRWSQSRHIALLSPQAPGANWRRMAKRVGKRLVHVPLGQFGDSTIQQLRMMHVLNGKQVRSYAAHFIRKA
jgi:hypothetical protein